MSHAWGYNAAYYNHTNLLNEAAEFQYRNYSVPIHDPLVDPHTLIGQSRLAAMLVLQIRPVQWFLAIGGMYAGHKYWIDKEMVIAESYIGPLAR